MNPVRPSVRLLVSTAVALALVPPSGAAPARPLPPSRSAPAPAAPAPAAPAPVDVRLRADPGSVLKAASYPPGAALAARATVGTRWVRTAALDTATYTMVALTWRGAGAEFRVRTRTEGRWTRWRDLEPMTDLPDRASAEGNGRRGTELLWVGPSDGVEVSLRGARPRQLRLELIDPGRLASDRTPASTAPSTAPVTAPVTAPGSAGVVAKAAPRPAFHYRGQWGADEGWRDGGPYYGRTIQQVHLHHTATSNGYTAAEVPQQIRGMYRYHTATLGWSDIGYNFLVDRFGRTWVGRAGGVERIVRGAHTLGFNHTSVGIAVIGNYEVAEPSEKVITAIVRLAAWKLDRFHRRPTGSIRVYSHGSDRYAAGRTVTLRVIDGHRDTNETACPGANLYAKLTVIRNRTQQRVDAY